ncbi:rhombosortase [Salinispirillum sp. LH 10-3-1]|uniref:Rhombosortase n=1 Tax=Salinispirillum sp. LH 10-3-1 TaxID=2952525 RepID=A0AB38YDJ8_9GAMM
MFANDFDILCSMNLNYITPWVAVLGCFLGLLWVDAWQYSRSALESGHWWVMLSGHFAHGNLPHTLVNAAGLLLATLLAPHWMNRWTGLLVLALLSILLSGAIHFGQPDVAIYRGFSGTLHGWVLLAIVLSPHLSRPWQTALAALIGIKLSGEKWLQAGQSMPSYLGDLTGEVLTVAHLYGAVLGAMVAAFVLLASHLGLYRPRLR